MRRSWIAAGGVALALGDAGSAAAADAAHAGLDGARLGLGWAAPFAGLLLTIAILPQLAPRLWHKRFEAIAAAWALALALPLAVVFGPAQAARELVHAALLDYLPFIALLFALFVIAGGVRVKGQLGGAPLANTGLLAFGALLASVMGTTGAAMLLVRPLIEGNRARPRNAHVLVFFIFLVANLGGALTPIGDPPLFLGFLHGVTFGWTFAHMAGPLLVAGGLVLAAFFLIDRTIWRRDGGSPGGAERDSFAVEGAHNLLLIMLAVGAVLASGVWRPGVVFDVMGAPLALQDLAREAALGALAWLSWTTTPKRVRIENAFTWAPLAEVVWLFAAIFVTIIPVLAILKAGPHGALAPVTALVTGADGRPHDLAYFWTTGLLSSVLDNAPTYLVFFNLAGADAATLMGPLARTLAAISAGAVFMGALTYIGNAPNFMVRAIAKERGVRMPSFFGYVGWSAAVLLPVFAVVTALFFR